MGIVAILCPKTSLHISTGLEMDQAAFDALDMLPRSVDCWACGRTHSWSRRWAIVVECNDPVARRAGATIPRWVNQDSSLPHGK
jgi:hypothetical protein